MAEVNGFFDNPHYVMGTRVEAMKQYISRGMDTLMSSLLAELGECSSRWLVI